jgi:hypothetical protein
MAIQGLTPPAAIFDADAWNPDFNKSGLHGLKIGQTIGLTTVGVSCIFGCTYTTDLVLSTHPVGMLVHQLKALTTWLLNHMAP